MIHNKIFSVNGTIKEVLPGTKFSQPLFYLFFTFSAFFLLVSGCQSPQDSWPKIKDSTLSSNNITRPPIPTTSHSDWVPPVVPTPSDIPRSWYPPSSAAERPWQAIIVHHSATETGNMALFDKEHKSLGWDGVGYDFVIGNGSDSGDGQVEVTFRWKQQIQGAHCKTPDNWANEYGIGICLVGNFNDTLPTQKQMQSLVKLTDFLQKRYRIPQSRIYGHGTTPGAHITDCPGKRFPMAKFKSMLNF
jgi:hypothetical protein